MLSKDAGSPGLVALWPGIDRMVRVDLRTITLTIPPQEVITRDNVPARMAAVCYFRVVTPESAITEIEAFAPATSQIAQTTLPSVVGRADLDQLLAERDRLNDDLQKIIDEQTEPWGIKVSTVEIKDVEIPEAMQRAMARQAEAERERRAHRPRRRRRNAGRAQDAARLGARLAARHGALVALVATPEHDARHQHALENDIAAVHGITGARPLVLDEQRPRRRRRSSAPPRARTRR